VSVLWLNPGFFVCRFGDNFKDNSPYRVLPSCPLLLCVFGFVLCFLCLFLLTLFFWVDFFGSLPPFLTVYNFSGFLALPPFFFFRCSSPFYKPSRLPPISPAFAGLLSSTNEIVGERRGPRLDWIRCRFSSLLNRDGEDEHDCSTRSGDVSAAMDFTSNDAVSSNKWTFLFWSLNCWKFGNWTLKKIPLNFVPLD